MKRSFLTINILIPTLLCVTNFFVIFSGGATPTQTVTSPQPRPMPPMPKPPSFLLRPAQPMPPSTPPVSCPKPPVIPSGISQKFRIEGRRAYPTTSILKLRMPQVKPPAGKLPPGASVLCPPKLQPVTAVTQKTVKQRIADTSAQLKNLYASSMTNLHAGKFDLAVADLEKTLPIFTRIMTDKEIMLEPEKYGELVNYVFEPASLLHHAAAGNQFTGNAATKAQGIFALILPHHAEADKQLVAVAAKKIAAAEEEKKFAALQEEQKRVAREQARRTAEQKKIEAQQVLMSSRTALTQAQVANPHIVQALTELRDENTRLKNQLKEARMAGIMHPGEQAATEDFLKRVEGTNDPAMLHQIINIQQEFVKTHLRARDYAEKKAEVCAKELENCQMRTRILAEHISEITRVLQVLLVARDIDIEGFKEELGDIVKTLQGK